MKGMLHAGKFLLADMASTLLFLAIYLWTENVPLSVALGIAFGFLQIAWQSARKRPIDTMQWLRLFLVVTSGTATLLTNDPHFVMYKPSVIYVIVGIVMLRPGWMNRYLPAGAIEVVADLAYAFGFVWAVLMFFSAWLNIYIAQHYSVTDWAAFMSLYGLASKLGLFLIQYTVMRLIGRRRRANGIGSNTLVTAQDS